MVVTYLWFLLIEDFSEKGTVQERLPVTQMQDNE